MNRTLTRSTYNEKMERVIARKQALERERHQKLVEAIEAKEARWRKNYICSNQETNVSRRSVNPSLPKQTTRKSIKTEIYIHRDAPLSPKIQKLVDRLSRPKKYESPNSTEHTKKTENSDRKSIFQRNEKTGVCAAKRDPESRRKAPLYSTPIIRGRNMRRVDASDIAVLMNFILDNVESSMTNSANSNQISFCQNTEY
ncbi:hypothetical protein ACOME3_007641 [Neoechinorhynchus agilis]